MWLTIGEKNRALYSLVCQFNLNITINLNTCVSLGKSMHEFLKRIIYFIKYLPYSFK